MRKIRMIIALILLSLSTLSLVGCYDILTAYDIAVQNGFSGTEEEWLASLKGADGTDGTDGADALSALDMYNAAKAEGYTGTFYDFISEYLVTEKTTSTEAAIQKGLQSVVAIYCEYTTTVTGFHPTSTEYASAGSGVIYSIDKTSGDAIIITNYHVVYDAESDTTDNISDSIYLYLYGMTYPSLETKITASYLGGSMTYDIAILSVDNSEIIKNSNAIAVDFADSNDIVVGDTALAIGNPEGEGISATSGIVSVDSEYIELLAADEATTIAYRVMRIDASVNGGNSGGGLFNDDGDLIGIVNAKSVDTSIEGMAYAIPSTLVRNVVENIVYNNGSVNKCVFGVLLEGVNPYSYYDSTDLAVRINETVTINELSTNSIALTAGLAVGDVIDSIEINGVTHEINRVYELVDFSLVARPNDTITFNVLRGTTLLEIEVICSQSSFQSLV